MVQDYRDLISGQTLPYHDDEYIRQAFEKHLVALGYGKDTVEVEARRCLEVDSCPFEVRADLMLLAHGRPAAVVRCARGSLVSREKETLATARLISDPIAPFCVVTNGDDAEFMDSRTGKVLASGMESIPDPQRLAELVDQTEPHHATDKELKQATRVYTAYAFIQCPGVCRA